MAVSSEWEGCSSTKTVKGKAATATILNGGFWKGVNTILKVFEPLVEFLRMVDGDGPSMAFLYGQLLETKDKIKAAMNNLPANYNTIMEAIEGKMKDRLDAPLHMTCYLLNPYYSYQDQTIFQREDVNMGFQECVEQFYHDNIEAMDAASNAEFDLFRDQVGASGRPIAKLGCQKRDYNPTNWWTKYGGSTPNLQRMAIRLLSLTSSSSGCERNWSTFDMVHTKRRNRLDTQCVSNLVYVQFNARLMDKKERCNNKSVDVLLASDASNAQDWIIDCKDEVEPETGLVGNEASEDMQPRRSKRVRELYEDDFKSDSEAEEIDDDDFESDQDGVIGLKDYGQEDED